MTISGPITITNSPTSVEPSTAYTTLTPLKTVSVFILSIKFILDW